jgi:ATP-dependent exoDNAse (exonuclease V) beta subunit
MRLIQEQIDAVFFGEGRKEIAIHAGAGAGKTGVLTERYVHAVKDLGESPAELLTITFTRKAAAEMKKRIVDRLRAEGLHEAARQAQVGPISTIHGYCERLLREYPFDAGLDPSFGILSPNATRELIDRCSAEVLADSALLDECEREFISVRGIRSFAGVRSETIEDWIYRTLDGFRTAGRSAGDLEHMAESADNVRELWRVFLESAARETNVVLDSNWLQDGVRAGGEPWMRAKGYEDVEQRAAVATQGLASLAARTWRKLTAEFDRLNCLDFSELETRALRLLQDNPEIIKGKYKRLLIDEAQDLNPVQYEIVRATPVDQMLLVGDPQQSIYGFRGAERSLFMGFLKDAETRSLVVNWRSTSLLIDGMKSVFERLWGDQYTRMRPSAPVASDDDPFDTGEKGFPIEIWKAGRGENAIADGMQRLITEGDRAGGITLLIPASTNLERIVRALRERAIDPLILGAGKRYFQRNEIRDLGSAMQAAANPLDNLAMLSLLRSPLVGVSLDGCLRCAALAPETKKPVLDLLMENAALDENDATRASEMLRWLLPIIDIADRVPAWEVLSRILADTHADLRFALAPNSAQLIANSRKLLTIAMENREMSAAEFGEWIANRQSIRISGASALSDAEYSDADDEESRPSIATMHSAKGLEWDTVIVDASDRVRKSDKDDLEIDPFAGILAVAVREPGVLEKDRLRPRAHAAIAHRNQKREIDEMRRLLYVAMTRARKRLVVVIDAARKGPCAADLLAGLAPNWQGSPNVIVRDFTQGPTRTMEDRA